LLSYGIAGSSGRVSIVIVCRPNCRLGDIINGIVLSAIRKH
jgi:hypothetical protein